MSSNNSSRVQSTKVEWQHPALNGQLGDEADCRVVADTRPTQNQPSQQASHKLQPRLFSYSPPMTSDSYTARLQSANALVAQARTIATQDFAAARKLWRKAGALFLRAH